MGGRATDLVAVMNHSELADWRGTMFTEHVNRSDKKIFSIRNQVRARKVKTLDERYANFDTTFPFRRHPT